MSYRKVARRQKSDIMLIGEGVVLESKNRYKHWLDAALYDLDSAKVMLNAGRYKYVAFMSQQAIEKLIKAVYLHQMNEEPPRSHNINYLLSKMIENENNLGSRLLSFRAKYEDLFVDLLAYYIGGRYPDYQEDLKTKLTRELAAELFGRTREAFNWLREEFLKS